MRVDLSYRSSFLGSILVLYCDFRVYDLCLPPIYQLAIYYLSVVLKYFNFAFKSCLVVLLQKEVVFALNTVISFIGLISRSRAY